MTDKVDIWMPLYIGDYLADTSHLDAAQHGCYLLWLMHYWRKGPLLDDIEGLVRMGRLQGPKAPETAQALLKEFFTRNRDGHWHQKRLDAERAKWLVKKDAAVQKAKDAAAARWSDASSNAPSNAYGTGQAMLKQCPLPSSVSLPLTKPSESLPASRGKARDNGGLAPLSSILSGIQKAPEPLPKNRREMIEANYKFSNDRPCTACGEELEWWKSPKGGSIPVLKESGAVHLGNCAEIAKAAN